MNIYICIYAYNTHERKKRELIILNLYKMYCKSTCDCVHYFVRCSNKKKIIKMTG